MSLFLPDRVSCIAIVRLALPKWEAVSGRIGGYLTRFLLPLGSVDFGRLGREAFDSLKIYPRY